MAGLTTEHVIALRTNALNRVLACYAIGIFGMLGAAWLVLSYGQNATLPVKLLLLSTALAAAAFTALAVPAAWGEVEGLRKDKSDAMRGTAYETFVDKSPISLFNNLSVLTPVVFVVFVAWVLFL